MLDAYIIDAIRQEEEERERQFERRRIRLELPIHRPRDDRNEREKQYDRRRPEEEQERGPIVIPLDPMPETDAA